MRQIEERGNLTRYVCGCRFGEVHFIRIPDDRYIATVLNCYLLGRIIITSITK
jgi:hypothetical protein